MRSGPTPGKTFLLEKEEILLGRDLANEIPISDPEVSRRHARFMMQGENIMVEDLGSTNGTFLNGQRISSPQQLRAGDVITLGEDIVLAFEQVGFDPDATVVKSQADLTARAVPQPTPPAPSYQQPAPTPQPTPKPAPMPAAYPEQAVRGEKKKKKIPAWLIVLIVAIVVVACVIAVTLYFMPASWWCAITFNMLEGCPIP
jgi:hypothetical protein